MNEIDYTYYLEDETDPKSTIWFQLVHPSFTRIRFSYVDVAVTEDNKLTFQVDVQQAYENDEEVDVQTVIDDPEFQTLIKALLMQMLESAVNYAQTHSHVGELKITDIKDSDPFAPIV